MNPANKNFIISMIDKLSVSVTTQPNIIMYHMLLPDDKALTICAETIYSDHKNTTIYYTIFLDDDLLEETTVDTSKKTITSVAKDIIELMRMCNTKIMLQEAHLARSKFMIHEISNQKHLS